MTGRKGEGLGCADVRLKLERLPQVLGDGVKHEGYKFCKTCWAAPEATRAQPPMRRDIISIRPYRI